MTHGYVPKLYAGYGSHIIGTVMSPTKFTYTLNHLAYVKIILHAKKHAADRVNGILLGRVSSGNEVVIEDAIPLLHLWTSLSPMMSIGLDLAKYFAEEGHLIIVGYYQASDKLDDRALYPVGEAVANKIRENFEGTFALVIDSTKLGTGDISLIPYVSSGADQTRWRSINSFTSPFHLAESTTPTRTLSLLDQNPQLHNDIGDFDDHLADVSIDWLKNPTVAKAIESGRK